MTPGTFASKSSVAGRGSWCGRPGRAGDGARGLAFGLIGGFLVSAGWHASPDQARGLGGALAALASEPAGAWLLGGVAIGLMGYGLHMLVSARYREMVLM